jgi:hypothetical protein
MVRLERIRKKRGPHGRKHHRNTYHHKGNFDG